MGKAGAASGARTPQRSLGCRWAPHPLACLCREAVSPECPQNNLERAFFCSGRTMCLEFSVCFLQQSAPTPPFCAAEAQGAARCAQPHSPSLAQSRVLQECLEVMGNRTETDLCCLKDLNPVWAKLWRGQCSRQKDTAPSPSAFLAGAAGVCSCKVWKEKEMV